MSRYYGDLSGESSSNNESSEEDDEEVDEDVVHSIVHTPRMKRDTGSKEQRHSESDDERYIVHADVDCFYCQCEILDRKIPADRPFAIGQKHIIVTSNYAARSMGVGKLQLRTEAYKLCPSLLIVEGSDLERYRIHARNIYMAFRQACQELGCHKIRKGSMDEMMADLSECIPDQHSSLHLHDIYVYGNQTETTELKEDQTGASVLLQTELSEYTHAHSSSSQVTRIRRFHAVADLCCSIRQRILAETGFTTTLGVSSNPMLAKLAGGLRKPATANILYPWRATKLVQGMPLRKIPGIGRAMVRVLQPCLKHAHGSPNDESTTWTCRDLLAVSHDEVERCFSTVPNQGGSSRELASIVLQKSRGIDISEIEDDRGCMPKTVSVENTFKRRSLVTHEGVVAAMEDLYHRLPRLLNERRKCATQKKCSYPRTIRLTIRFHCPEFKATNRSRRPFVSTSKQVTIDGKPLMSRDLKGQSDILRCHIDPLLKELVLNKNKIDITRLSIAATNFVDPSTLRESSVSVHRQTQASKGARLQALQVTDGTYSDIPTRPCDQSASRVADGSPNARHVDGDMPLKVLLLSPISLRKRRRIDQFFDTRN